MKNSIAGTLESNDVLIELFVWENERVIEIESVVKKQFGSAIHALINAVLDEYKIDHIKVVVNDKGALDYTLKARLKTALQRGEYIDSVY